MGTCPVPVCQLVGRTPGREKRPWTCPTSCCRWRQGCLLKKRQSLRRAWSVCYRRPTRVPGWRPRRLRSHRTRQRRAQRWVLSHNGRAAPERAPTTARWWGWWWGKPWCWLGVVCRIGWHSGSDILCRTGDLAKISTLLRHKVHVNSCMHWWHCITWVDRAQTALPQLMQSMSRSQFGNILYTWLDYVTVQYSAALRVSVQAPEIDFAFETLIYLTTWAKDETN